MAKRTNPQPLQPQQMLDALIKAGVDTSGLSELNPNDFAKELVSLYQQHILQGNVPPEHPKTEEKTEEKAVAPQVQERPVVNIPQANKNSTLHDPVLHDNDRIEALQAELDAFKKERAEIYAKLDAIIEEKKSPASNHAVDALSDPKVIAVLRAIGDNKDNKGRLRDGYTPKDDRVEPVIFFSNLSGLYYYNRIEAGMVIALPEGSPSPIRFKRLWRYGISGESRVRVRYTFTTDNRRVIEFLRKHADFGAKFFISENEALKASFNKEWSDSFQRYMNMMKTRPDHVVTQMAHAYGIPVGASDDPDKWRQAVARRMADDDMITRNAAEQASAGADTARNAIQQASVAVSA